MKKIIKKIIKKTAFLREVKDYVKFSGEFRKEKIFWVRNHKGTENSSKQLGYSAMMQAHALEKGMSFDNPRPFGKEKVSGIIANLRNLTKEKNYEHCSAFIIPLNTLREYLRFYETHNWTNEPEYKTVYDFVSQHSHIITLDTGTEIISKQELTQDNLFDYAQFLKTRHSIRKFATEKIAEKDIHFAIEAAKYSPSACNRQMIKIYHLNSQKTDMAIKSSIQTNLSGFDIATAQPFIVTFDAAAFGGVFERNQGWLNAGFFAMNFVNALHSIGIGSCFCEFHLSITKENELKLLLGIPESERIAVVIMAGYYCEENKIYKSPRVSSAEIYRII